MSTFVGRSAIGGIGAPLMQQSDGRVMAKNFQWGYTGSQAYVKPWADGMLWTRSRMGGSDSAGILLGNDYQSSGRYDNDQQDVLGGGQTKKIIGTTRDGAGNPLGSVTVQGFLTASDTFVGQTVSDSGGYYELPTVYAGQAHYLVAYKSGSPDVAGASVNTLIPV